MQEITNALYAAIVDIEDAIDAAIEGNVDATKISDKKYVTLVNFLDFFVEEFCGIIPLINEKNAEQASKTIKHCHWLFTKGAVVEAIVALCAQKKNPTHSVKVARQYLLHYQKLILPKMEIKEDD